MQTSAFFGAKIRIFRNLWRVRTDKRERDQPVRTRVVNFFEIFVRAAYGDPLRKLAKKYCLQYTVQYAFAL